MQAPPQDGATGADPPAAVTPFPAPPPWFRLYARGTGATGAPPPPLPPQPPPRADEPLVLFGAEFCAVEPALPPLQVPDLLRQAASASGEGQTDQDARRALHLLLDALLAAALRLLDGLADEPAAYAQRATSAIAALHNLMHRVNALRPGQTRRAIAAALEAQVENKRAAALEAREAAAAAGREVARRAAALERAVVAKAEAIGGDGVGTADDAMEGVEGAGDRARNSGKAGKAAAAATAAGGGRGGGGREGRGG
jgi:hypothetical protein